MTLRQFISNMLDNIYNAIVDISVYFHTETIELSPVNDNVEPDIGKIQLARRSGVVYYRINGIKLKPISGRKVIANIPAKYRPNWEVTGLINRSTTIFGIRSNGDIWVDAGDVSNKQIWGNTTGIALN